MLNERVLIYKQLRQMICLLIFKCLFSLTDRSIDLDIPLELVELSEYRATLGHKACHSFGEDQNARFDNLYHSRYAASFS